MGERLILPAPKNSLWLRRASSTAWRVRAYPKTMRPRPITRIGDLPIPWFSPIMGIRDIHRKVLPGSPFRSRVALLRTALAASSL